jgi:sulfur carrier protein
VRAAGARYNQDAQIEVTHHPRGDPHRVKIILRNPKREVELSGRRRVKELLVELDILAGTVLVIRGDELLTSDSVVGDGDVVEVRPVMSGGSAGIIPGVTR